MDESEFFAWEKTTRDTIDFKKIYVDIAGDLVAGLALSEIIFWYLPNLHSGKTKLRVEKDGYLWIARARHDWWERTRITPKRIDRVLLHLGDNGLIVKKIYKFNGAPTIHVRIVWETFLERLQALVHDPLSNPHVSPVSESERSISPIGENPDPPLRDLHLAKRDRSLTETTAENTSEKTNREKDSKGHACARPPAAGYTPGFEANSAQALDLQEPKSCRQAERHTDKGKALTDQETVEEEPGYTPFEQWLLAACYNTKHLSEKQRLNFHKRVRHLDSERKVTQSPTVTQAWDSDPVYQGFVRDVILLEVQAKRLAHPTGFDNWLNAPRTWERFYAWREAHGDEYGAASSGSAAEKEEGCYMMWPDGGKTWVPYSQDINDAYQEYLRGKEQE